jgi:hypothetical protein
LEHHGAQRCTTLTSGDLIASRIFCSAGDGSAREAGTARSVVRINKRNIDILGENTRETECTQGLGSACALRVDLHAENA